MTSGQCDYVVSLRRRRGCALAAQSTAQNPPELLATYAVDDEVGRRTKHFQNVAQFHEEERAGRTALRIVLPDDLYIPHTHTSHLLTTPRAHTFVIWSNCEKCLLLVQWRHWMGRTAPGDTMLGKGHPNKIIFVVGFRKNTG